MEKLIAELLDELIIELEIDTTDTASQKLLEVKLKGAIREVRAAFNFHDYHTEDFILKELTNHVYNIKALAVYDFAKVGAEGEDSHSEKNITRTYHAREKCFSGIVRYAD